MLIMANLTNENETDIPANPVVKAEGVTVDELENYVKYSKLLTHKRRNKQKLAYAVLYEGKKFTTNRGTYEPAVSIESGKAIRELIKIASMIEDGGTLILGGCTIAEGEEGNRILKALAELTGYRINIYGNTNFTGQGTKEIIKLDGKQIILGYNFLGKIQLANATLLFTNL